MSVNLSLQKLINFLCMAGAIIVSAALVLSQFRDYGHKNWHMIFLILIFGAIWLSSYAAESLTQELHTSPEIDKYLHIIYRVFCLIGSCFFLFLVLTELIPSFL